MQNRPVTLPLDVMMYVATMTFLGLVMPLSYPATHQLIVILVHWWVKLGGEGQGVIIAATLGAGGIVAQLRWQERARERTIHSESERTRALQAAQYASTLRPHAVKLLWKIGETQNALNRASFAFTVYGTFKGEGLL